MARSTFTDGMKVHVMVLGRINRTAWGTKLLLTAVWASLVDCTSSRHLLKAQHCSLSLNGCFTPPSAPHLPHHPSHPLPLIHPTPSHLPTPPSPTRPPPIESICDITRAEKSYVSKNRQYPSSL